MTKDYSFQMAFEFDIPEDEADVSAGLSAEQIQARKDEARERIVSGEAFDKNDNDETIFPAWFENFIQYEDGGYPTRVAVYMAWLGLPNELREPRTKKELANLLGLSSPRQFYIWEEKYPDIRDVAKNIWRRKILDGMPGAVDAMVTVASWPDYKGKPDRELLFRMGKELNDEIVLKNEDVDLSKLSYEDKLALAGLDTPEKLAAYRASLTGKKSEGDE